MALTFPSSPTVGQSTFTGGKTWVWDGSRWTEVSVYADDFTMMLAVTDESSLLTTGTAKVTYRTPFALNLYKLPRTSLVTSSASGNVVIDVKYNGTSIYGVGNKTTIDVANNSSVGSSTQPNLLTMNTNIPDDAVVTVDIVSAGTNARGLKLILYALRVV